MNEPQKSKREGPWLWLGIVSFLLVFPPGLPFALSTDRPLFSSLLAIGFALVLGTAIWAMAANLGEKKGRGQDRRKSTDRRDELGASAGREGSGEKPGEPIPAPKNRDTAKPDTRNAHDR